jgi:hypothetical protein
LEEAADGERRRAPFMLFLILTVLTSPFLPALDVAWFRVKEPATS